MTHSTAEGARSVPTLDITEQMLTTPRKRAHFIKTMMVASAGVAAVGLATPAAAARNLDATVPQGDLDILNFALTLEHLEKAFYDQAVAQVPFTDSKVKALAATLQKDETAHVAALTAAITQLGGTPVGAAHYNFGASTFTTQSNFLAFSQVLEDTGVHAYLGQAPNIKTPAILLTAASIVTIEARHAGSIRYQLGLPVTISPFDDGYTREHVLAIAGPLITG